MHHSNSELLLDVHHSSIGVLLCAAEGVAVVGRDVISVVEDVVEDVDQLVLLYLLELCHVPRQRWNDLRVNTGPT